MNTLILGLAVIVAAPAPKEGKKADPPSLIGEWTIESMSLGGKPLPKQANDGPTTITFTKEGTAVAVDKPGAKPDNVKFTHDPKASPMQIDLEEAPGMKMSGIYKIDGDTLTMCVSIMGERPKSFDPSDSTMLMVLKRIKKD
jgi:uncharacterized protein (TIGR03067 family)